MTFIDNRNEVKAALKRSCVKSIIEACGELVSQAERNSKVVTGKTKGSYQYKVDEDKLEGFVGSNYENAIWEEFGTGEYALNGDGRKGGWWIKVGYGSGEIPPSTVGRYKWAKVRRDKAGNIEYVFTYGKKPKRPLFKAFVSKKNILKRIIERNIQEEFK